MSLDKFDQISYAHPKAFSNASGDDNYPLAVGSRGVNVKLLQGALNNRGASLTVDGAFGNLTKSALIKVGFNYPVNDEAELQEILRRPNAGAYSQEVGNVSQSDLNAMYRKYTSGGGTKTYDQWFRSEQQKSNLKKIGGNLFQVGLDWLRNQQAGNPDGGVTEYNYPQDTTGDTKILGMPRGVVYAGGAVLTVLAIWGIVSLAKKAGKPKAPAPRYQPNYSGRP